MGHIKLTKHEGLGNDFLVAVNPERPFTSAEAQRWCDRRRGVGADGFIELRAGDLWQMTLWNADGSRAEISGNGLRCAAQALSYHLGGETELKLMTDTGVRLLSVTQTDDADLAMVRVDMGSVKAGVEPSPDWAEAGVAVQAQLGVDIGNPHIVGLVEDLASYDIAEVGPTIEARYPLGINVHLISVSDRSMLELKVWERGVGVTEACGSGACAAAHAAIEWGLVDAPVTVVMPGGAATVEVDDGSIWLTGPARFIASVVVHG